MTTLKEIVQNNRPALEAEANRLQRELDTINDLLGVTTCTLSPVCVTGVGLDGFSEVKPRRRSRRSSHIPNPDFQDVPKTRRKRTRKPATAATNGETKAETKADVIAKFLMDNGPSTAAHIIDGTGIKRPTVYAAIRNNAKFKKDVRGYVSIA